MELQLAISVPGNYKSTAGCALSWQIKASLSFFFVVLDISSDVLLSAEWNQPQCDVHEEETGFRRISSKAKSRFHSEVQIYLHFYKTH